MQISQLLADSRPVFSIEFFPPRTEEGVQQLFDAIDDLRPLAPDFVSITYGAGGSTREGTAENAARIRAENDFEVMAHLSCVGETRDGLRQMLDRFAAAGIDNVLALRGDPPRGESEFKVPTGGLANAAELAEFIGDEGYEFDIGGTCFPEGHPDAVSPEADIEYLRSKVDAGCTFLITQMFFDNAVYWEFVGRARQAGIDVPIIPGVIPITRYAQVARICDLCDASIPDTLAKAMDALGGDEDAERLLGIAYAARQCEELLAGGAPGIHFIALNRAAGTRAVLSALKASRPSERVPDSFDAV